jgi:uncharacterized protein (DUF1778 family)
MHHAGADRRRFRITFRVSALEHQTLKAAADNSGLQLSSFVRATVLAAKPLRSARRPSVETVLLVKVLDRLGIIASSMRALLLVFTVRSGVALPAVERDLSRTLSELRALRPELLHALGKRPSAP